MMSKGGCMDLSKLPRLSETDKHAPPPQPPEESRPAPDAYQPVQVQSEGVAAQVWLSGILGLVFMLMGRNFARYLIAKLTGQEFHTGVNWTAGPKTGQEVAYFELAGYTAYTDTGIFLFGLAMVLEAVVLAFVRRSTPATRALVTIALVITAGMTLFNLVLVVMLMSTNTLPIISLLVVAFGGFLTHWQWQMFQQLSFKTT
jgi:hypothetical protein